MVAHRTHNFQASSILARFFSYYVTMLQYITTTLVILEKKSGLYLNVPCAILCLTSIYHLPCFLCTVLWGRGGSSELLLAKSSGSVSTDDAGDR